MDKELTLRAYQERDIPRVVDIIEYAIPLLPNYRAVTPNRERIRYVLEHHIDNGSAFAGWVLCDSHDVPQGIGGGWCVASILSLDLIADDIFMWVEPQYRTHRNVSKLVHTYIDWARSKGAKLIRASHTGGSFPRTSKEGELYHAMLTRMGFQEVGNIYHLQN